jgi:hypothetical protein
MSCVPRRILLSLLPILCLGSICAAAESSRNEFPTWTKQGVLSGATSTKAECVRLQVGHGMLSRTRCPPRCKCVL